MLRSEVLRPRTPPPLAAAPVSPSQPVVTSPVLTAPPKTLAPRDSRGWSKSHFDQDEHSEVSSVRLGGEQTGKSFIRRPDLNLLYDGGTAAEGLLVTNPEAVLSAPVQSHPGQRTVVHTRNVINQFAVATNPRYLPRLREPREAGHVFVFDVMCAQHTTLGRAFPSGFPGTFRQGTLAELWKWLSVTARSRGWREVEGGALLEAAAKGLPIVAMAETSSGPRLAVVEPGPPGPGGTVRLASAHAPRGQQRAPEQVFGASPVRYLAHD